MKITQNGHTWALKLLLFGHHPWEPQLFSPLLSQCFCFWRPRYSVEIGIYHILRATFPSLSAVAIFHHDAVKIWALSFLNPSQVQNSSTQGLANHQKLLAFPLFTYLYSKPWTDNQDVLSYLVSMNQSSLSSPTKHQASELHVWDQE